MLDSQVSGMTGVGFDSQVIDSHVNDKYKIGEEYHAVPPPYTENFMPLKPDLVLVDKNEYVFSEISDSENENETESMSGQRKPSNAKVEFVKSNEHVKSTRESVKKEENNKQAKNPRKYSQSPRDCDFYEKKMVEKPIWNNARIVNHQNSQKVTHPHPKRNFVPRAVLMNSGLKTLNTARQCSLREAVSVNTARPINTAYPRPTVNSARITSNVFNKAHSHVRRPFNKYTTNKNSNFNEKVNIVRKNVTTIAPKAVVSDNKGNEANDVTALACWVWRLKHKVLDHVSINNGASMSFKIFDYVDAQGRSKHITRNKSYHSDYKEINGGFVAFGGNSKRGKITGKVSRKDNMYSVDLRNVIPQGGLTCLFAKATLDEYNLWHKRLGHINFKTMNTPLRGNLVRGLPSKIFENDHTYVSCQKGKQHKASCKTKTMTLVDLVVFFLATMDETSGILKAFITGIENQINHRVKIIRCDNGTEFKSVIGLIPLDLTRPRWNVIIATEEVSLLGNTGHPEIKTTETGSGPEWLFDIDTVTKSMNYKLVVSRNQTNGNAGTKKCLDAGQAEKKTVPSHEYILLLLYAPDSPISSSLQTSNDVLRAL
ncbi:ribonuclease H-like domain-containing protein [Tanacetum coccineum]|uniref:Ribonuclease H-like domain-containing protein n=1 Tax=Tanacetum coccineum TaxID=301880 RepID=A0ABQ5F7U2_9ASTR